MNSEAQVLLLDLMELSVVYPMLSILNAYFCLTLLIGNEKFHVSCHPGTALPKAKENIYYFAYVLKNYLIFFSLNNFILFSAVFASVVKQNEMRQERRMIYMMDECFVYWSLSNLL